MADPRRRSPLAHRDAIKSASGACEMSERPLRGKLVLRGDADIIGGAVQSATGAALPTTPNRSAQSGDTYVFWIGPDEWWFVTGREQETALAQALARAMTGTHHQLVDVTDYHTTVRISGPKARETLMKLTTLDLHPRGFEKGQVAGSMFGHAQAVLHQTAGDDEDDGPTFEIHVRASMADYLWCLLAEAGRPFGMPEQPSAVIVPIHHEARNT